MNRIAENVVRIEAEALRALAERLAGPMAEPFQRAVELVDACKGRVVVTGMGKSGIVARKIAATLSSTGTPALFLHPAEALHGDLGMVVRGDVVVALSASGETQEIAQLLPTIKRLQVPLISFTCEDTQSFRSNAGESPASTRASSKQASAPAKAPRLSTLAQAADVALDCSVAKEACSLGLAPTASTTTMMALGDALAMALAEKRGFKEEDFADLHPGGKLGKRLARVSTLMHTGDAIPQVAPATRMADVIYEMSRKKLGMTTVIDRGKLVGIISDGDLRRLLERQGQNGRNVLDMTAAGCMTRQPKTISPETYAATALDVMEQGKITSLVVVGQSNEVVGVVHLHDLWGTEVV
jgi:arabinose-5-phosphate isomerase